jgi:CPA1 family monovalent cation:H+ antiporter
MSLYTLISIVIACAAVFSYINHRFIGLPTTIGVTLIALVLSLALLGADGLGLPVHTAARSLIARLDFSSLVLEGMVALLLFAGALSVDLEALKGQKVGIMLLASLGSLVSMAVVGGLTYLASRAFGLGVNLLESLLFGALISPTDPVAVLSILRAAGAPKALEAQIAGESLFNDGMAVAVFSVLLDIATAEPGAGGLGAGSVAIVFGREIVGSLALGVGVGWLAYLMFRSVDDDHVEVLLTLALALGLYSLASAVHASGPLAVVAAGLLTGGRTRRRAMSARTVERLDVFWELVDEILNVMLFVLIGFELLVVPFTAGLLLVGAAAIGLVLCARAASVGLTALALSRFQKVPPHWVKIVTWGGLRGGVSIALALSLGPEITNRHFIQAATYVVAVFSIAVQGLTLGPLVRATTGRAPPAPT